MSIFSPPLCTVPQIELNDLMVGTFLYCRGLCHPGFRVYLFAIFSLQNSTHTVFDCTLCILQQETAIGS